MLNLSFYKNKKVLVTGHTGFKGTWLCRFLELLGADVAGYSLEAPTVPNLFSISENEKSMKSFIGDIRNLDNLEKVFQEIKPEIVFHLAAQPIVKEGYENPVYTYETNVMGTVNLLECARKHPEVKSIVNITTDKVYLNNEWCWGYREDDRLNGYDPYSNSKSCSELVTDCYKKSFFINTNTPISTVRAGNVIGGGDFAKNRIIPDCIRAVQKNETIVVRNPSSVRPYQHVLDPIYAYMMIAQHQYENPDLAGTYNIGPDECDCITTGKLVQLFCNCWGNSAKWETNIDPNAPHEASFLKLDCSKIKSVFKWKPKWNINKCVEMTCRFTKLFFNNENIYHEMNKEIEEFLDKQ